MRFVYCVALLKPKVIGRSCMIQLKGAFLILYFAIILYYITELNYIKSQTLLFVHDFLLRKKGHFASFLWLE